MSFISRLLKGYQTDTPVTTKEYIENKTLQGNKTIASIKNRNEFVEDVDISFPNLWYMFNNSSKLKNYGVQQANYDTNTTFTSNDLTNSTTHMNNSGQCITELNKNIIQEFENDFTLSLWCKGSGVLFRIYNGSSNYIKIDIGTNSLLLNGTSIGAVTIDTTAYNHILITKEYVYVNNIKVPNNISLPNYTFNYENDIVLLDANIEYYDMRIFNKILTGDKITKLYNLGTTIDSNSTLGVNGTYNKKVDKFDINVSGENAMSLAFWIDSSNANIDIISFADFKVGIKGKRFYTETFGKNKVFSNRRLKDESKYYFVCVSIENDGSSHTIKLYVDNFPVTGNSFKTAFTFNNFTDIGGNNIENLVIYKRVLDDIEVMDLFIRDIKTNETTDDNLNSLAYLFSDYSKDIDSTEPDTTYNLQLYSTSNLVEVTTTVTTTVDTVVEVEGGETTQETETTETTEETSGYDIYKFNKYPGYQGFKNDLYAWYKFEKANTEPITSIAPNMIDSSNVYLAFKHDGSTDNQTSYTVNFPEDTTCDILIVGGGGGGARRMAGGGGAGTLIYDTNITLNGTYTIKVGKGGSGSATAGNTNPNNDNIEDKRGNNGVDSEIIKSSSTIYKAKVEVVG